MPHLQQMNIDATTDLLIILNISEMIPEGQENVDYAQFRDYVSKMAAIDSTWTFWEQFGSFCIKDNKTLFTYFNA